MDTNTVQTILTTKNGYINGEEFSIAYRWNPPSNPDLQGIAITSIRSDVKGKFREFLTLLDNTHLPIFFDQVQSNRLKSILELNGYTLIDEVNNCYQK